MAKEPQLYVCKNPACSLGSMRQLGRFSGGISAEQKHLLTGDPLEGMEDGKSCGEGFCPNCGDKGEKFDVKKAQAGVLADAQAQFDAQVKAIKEGVA